MSTGNDRQPPPEPPRSEPTDPWGHEVGEDNEHLLGADGHMRHHGDESQVGKITIEVVKPKRGGLFRRK